MFLAVSIVEQGILLTFFYFFYMLAIATSLAKILFFSFFDSLLQAKETTNYCQWKCVFDWKELTREHKRTTSNNIISIAAKKMRKKKKEKKLESTMMMMMMMTEK